MVVVLTVAVRIQTKHLYIKYIYIFFKLSHNYFQVYVNLSLYEHPSSPAIYLHKWSHVCQELKLLGICQHIVLYHVSCNKGENVQLTISTVKSSCTLSRELLCSRLFPSDLQTAEAARRDR